MGLVPRDIDGLSWWQYTALCHEYSRLKEGKAARRDSGPMDDVEFERALEWHKANAPPGTRFKDC